MLALGTADVLNGVTTDADSVTFSISGLEMDTAEPPDAVAYQTLAQGSVPDSAGELYAPGGSNSALISSISIVNTSESIETVQLLVGSTIIAQFILSVGGWASYEDGAGWTIFGGNNSIILTGVGTPTIVASYQGQLYMDVSGTSGLWVATSTESNEDWMPLGAAGGYGSGISPFWISPGVFSLFVGDSAYDTIQFNGEGQTQITDSNGDTITMNGGTITVAVGNSLLVVNENGVEIVNQGITQAYIFVIGENPNGVVTAINVGDFCIDTGTPALWQATATGTDNWVEAGGGLPSWFQTGAGSPITNDDSATAIGNLFFDTSGSGLYVAWGTSPAQWSAIGAIGSGYGGLSVVNSGVDFRLADPSNTYGIGSNVDANGLTIFTNDGSFNLFTYTETPVGNLSPAAIGDLCVDTGTPALWQATGTGPTDWEQVGALANDGAYLAFGDSPVTPTTNTPVMDTDSLAVGKWLITFGAQCQLAGGGDIYAYVSEAGSATVSTYEGVFQSFQNNPDDSNEFFTTINFTCILTITAAGTIEFQADGDGASTIISAHLGNGGTGYTAVKIA